MGFWQSIGDWFVKLGESLGNFFMGKEEGEMSNLEKIFIALAIIIVAHFVFKLLFFCLKRAMGINKKKGPQIDKSAQSFGLEVLKIVLWIIVGFIVVAILGVNITSFAGIMSAIAVALGLALQDVIASFAYGLLILNEKNFITGDYILVANEYGSVEGHVQRVGLVSTRLKTFDGQLVIIPNGNLAKANVTNYTRYPERRIVLTVGIGYNDDVALAKQVLAEIVNSDKRIINDENHKTIIHVSELGPYSVNVTIKCWVDYKLYWDVYNELSEPILLKFRENKINIPSSTDIHVGKLD